MDEPGVAGRYAAVVAGWDLAALRRLRYDPLAAR